MARVVARLLTTILILSYSQTTIAGPYEDGISANQKQDYGTAIRIWKALVEKGHMEAQVGLGFLYYYGKGTPKNYKEAARLFTLAANQGHTNAQKSLALMYRDGVGVPKNLKETFKFLKMAAEQGNSADAQYELGVMLFQFI